MGNKWIGTRGGGVAKFDDVNWVVFNNSNSGLINNDVWDVAIETNDVKWFGTEPAGVARFFDSQWSFYHPSIAGQDPYTVWSIAIDNDNSKWFGTTMGLIHLDDTVWSNYSIANSGLSQNHVSKSFVDSRGNKWFGTNSSGIAVYNKNGMIYGIDNRTTTENNISVYPNPAKDKLTFERKNLSSKQDFSVSMYDINGRQVKSIKWLKEDNEITTDMSVLKPGIFFYTITSKSGNRICGKVIKL